MSEIISVRPASRIARVIDENIAKAADALDGFGDNLRMVVGEGSKSFAAPVVRYVGKASKRLRKVDGTELVDLGKVWIDRHPVALTVAAATAGAVLAGAAIIAVRNDRRPPTSARKAGRGT